MNLIEEALGALLVLAFVGVYCYAIVSSLSSERRQK